MAAGALLTGRSAAGSGFQSGTLRVEFSDSLGHFVYQPYVNIGAAAPGMAEVHASITLRNNGTIPAAYRVITTNLLDTAPDSLDQVLVVAVQKGREVLYRGSLSALLLSGDPLGPGEARTYELRISWPRGPHDDHYQGQSLAFSLQADAVPADG